jgi:hypothetical protein
MGVTPTPDTDQVEEFLTEVVATYLDEQPWWERYSNTVTQVISGLVVLATWASMYAASLPGWVAGVVGVVLFAGNVLSILRTRNGVTPRTADDLVQAMYVGRHRLEE